MKYWKPGPNGWKKKRRKATDKIMKMEMEAKGYALCDDFCNQGNKQKPHGSVERSETMTWIVMIHCLKAGWELASTNAGDENEE